MVKELAEVIAKLLSTVYQHSWSTREVPEDWRLASMTPIYKKGQKENPGNYRLVSLISVSGKIMERITESQNCRGWKGPLEIIESNPSAKAGSLL